jgi:hypothetical protein
VRGTWEIKPLRTHQRAMIAMPIMPGTMPAM